MVEGCILVLKGSNGTGKTSLLKIISGLIPPKKGEILYNNQPVKKYYDEYCSLIEYVGHQNALKQDLTVIENIEFWSKMKESVELIPAALKYFGLSDYADIPCYKLSAGWQRKVALARLMACNSKLWLLDEPFANLDSESQVMLQNLISIRCNEGGIVILTSHDEVKRFKTASIMNLEDFKK